MLRMRNFLAVSQKGYKSQRVLIVLSVCSSNLSPLDIRIKKETQRCGVRSNIYFFNTYFFDKR